MLFFVEFENTIYIQQPRSAHHFKINHVNGYERVGFTRLQIQEIQAHFDPPLKLDSREKWLNYNESTEYGGKFELWETQNSTDEKLLRKFIANSNLVTPNIKVETMLEYLSLIGDISRAFQTNLGTDIRAKIFYRGQASADWKLTPNIYRKQGKNGWVSLGGETMDVEKALNTIIEIFAKRIHPYLDNQVIGEKDLLAIGQHHGLPTNLLDWTSNPLVGLYFACAELIEEDGAIWVTKSVPIPPNDDFYNGELFRPKVVTRFIEAQRGFFSYHKNPHSHVPFGKIDEKRYPGTWSVLVKICISKDKKALMLHELQTIGIDESTIYPSLSGVARSIASELKQTDAEF